MTSATKSGQQPMIFAFRGMRLFQVLLAIAALGSGVGAAFVIKAFADNGGIVLLIAAVLLGLVFLWTFGAALRAPTSFVAITEERTRIRFAGFVDTVVDNRNILGAKLAEHHIIGGLGVRTSFRGEVALASASGPVAMLYFRQPLRIWLIPRLVPVKAYRLKLSVLHPARLVERFGAPTSAPVSSGAKKKTRQRGP